MSKLRKADAIIGRRYCGSCGKIIRTFTRAKPEPTVARRTAALRTGGTPTGKRTPAKPTTTRPASAGPAVAPAPSLAAAIRKRAGETKPQATPASTAVSKPRSVNVAPDVGFAAPPPSLSDAIQRLRERRRGAA